MPAIVALSLVAALVGLGPQDVRSARASPAARECLQRWGLRTLLGESVHAFDDVDGDGVQDVLVAVRGDHSGELGFGYALSGADGAVLWRFDRRGIAGRVVALPDVDGDGIRDVAAEFGAGTCHCGHDPPLDASSIRLFSGTDGSLIRRIPWPSFDPKPRWGPAFRLVGLEDRNEDGVGDHGLAFVDGLTIRSGTDDALIASSGEPTRSEPLERIEAIVLDDVDADGVDDVVLGVVPYRDETYCALISVGRAEVLGRFTGAGSRLAAIGDVDGDGVPDWVASTVDTGSLDPGSGTVAGALSPPTTSELVAVSGVTLSALWRCPRPEPRWLPSRTSTTTTCRTSSSDRSRGRVHCRRACCSSPALPEPRCGPWSSWTSSSWARPWTYWRMAVASSAAAG